MNDSIRLRDLPRFYKGLPVSGYSATISGCRTNEYVRFVGVVLRCILAPFPRLRRAVASVVQNIGEELGRGPEKIIRHSKAEQLSRQVDMSACGAVLTGKMLTNTGRLWQKR